MTNADLFLELQKKVSNDACQLHDGLSILVSDPKNSVAVKQCLQYIQSISSKAIQLALPNLQILCILAQKNILDLKQSSEANLIEKFSSLENWPKLVISYLYLLEKNDLTSSAYLKHIKTHYLNENIVKLLPQLLNDEIKSIENKLLLPSELNGNEAMSTSDTENYEIPIDDEKATPELVPESASLEFDAVDLNSDFMDIVESNDLADIVQTDADENADYNELNELDSLNDNAASFDTDLNIDEFTEPNIISELEEDVSELDELRNFETLENNNLNDEASNNELSESSDLVELENVDAEESFEVKAESELTELNSDPLSMPEFDGFDEFDKLDGLNEIAVENTLQNDSEDFIINEDHELGELLATDTELKNTTPDAEDELPEINTLSDVELNNELPEISEFSELDEGKLDTLDNLEELENENSIENHHSEDFPDSNTVLKNSDELAEEVTSEELELLKIPELDELGEFGTLDSSDESNDGLDATIGLENDLLSEENDSIELSGISDLDEELSDTSEFGGLDELEALDSQNELSNEDLMANDDKDSSDTRVGNSAELETAELGTESHVTIETELNADDELDEIKTLSELEDELPKTPSDLAIEASLNTDELAELEALSELEAEPPENSVFDELDTFDTLNNLGQMNTEDAEEFIEKINADSLNDELEKPEVLSELEPKLEDKQLEVSEFDELDELYEIDTLDDLDKFGDENTEGLIETAGENSIDDKLDEAVALSNLKNKQTENSEFSELSEIDALDNLDELKEKDELGEEITENVIANTDELDSENLFSTDDGFIAEDNAFLKNELFETSEFDTDMPDDLGEFGKEEGEIDTLDSDELTDNETLSDLEDDLLETSELAIDAQDSLGESDEEDSEESFDGELEDDFSETSELDELDDEIDTLDSDELTDNETLSDLEDDLLETSELAIDAQDSLEESDEDGEESFDGELEDDFSETSELDELDDEIDTLDSDELSDNETLSDLEDDFSETLELDELDDEIDTLDSDELADNETLSDLEDDFSEISELDELDDEIDTLDSDELADNETLSDLEDDLLETSELAIDAQDSLGESDEEGDEESFDGELEDDFSEISELDELDDEIDTLDSDELADNETLSDLEDDLLETSELAIDAQDSLGESDEEGDEESFDGELEDDFSETLELDELDDDIDTLDSDELADNETLSDLEDDLLETSELAIDTQDSLGESDEEGGEESFDGELEDDFLDTSELSELDENLLQESDDTDSDSTSTEDASKLDSENLFTEDSDLFAPDNSLFAEDDALFSPDDSLFSKEATDTDASDAAMQDIPEIFSELSEELANNSEKLSSALEKLVLAEDESEKLLEAVSEYTETLQNFWASAENAQLDGLVTACNFLNESVMALSMQPQVSRQETQFVVEAWSAMVLDYLLLPKEGAAPLAQHLCDEAWSEPLSEAQASHLTQQLLGFSAKGNTSETVEEVGFETELDEPLAGEVIEVVHTEQEASLADTLAPLTELLAQSIESLSESLTHLVSAEDESEELLEAASNYTEAVQPLSDSIDSLQLFELQAVCDFVNENVLALGMLPQAERQAAQENFDLWPGLLLDYCLVPEESAETLVTHFQNKNWPVPMSVEQARELQSALLSIAPTSTTPSEIEETTTQVSELSTIEQDIDLGDPAQIEILSAALLSAAEALSTALESFVSMDNSNELFFEALETYSSHLQEILDASEQAGLTGLQEVCTFINDNLIALSAEETATRQAAHEQLEQWPMLVLNYLTSPNESVEPLVKLLQSPQWATPLSAEQASDLAVSLQRGSMLSGQEEELALSKNDDEPVEELDELVEDVEDVESGEDAEIEMPDSGEISLGNSEMLEMLRGEIEDAKEDLAENLEKFCSLSNDDPAFTEVAENYSELVGRLAMASEMVGLVGLQEVCELINANVMELATQDQVARAKAQSALAKWPGLVNAYLEAPTEHVIALLNHLREDDWPAPLPDEKAHELLNNLSQSRNAGDDDFDDEPSRETEAKPEDVILAPPEDVNADLLAAFLEEAPQNAAELSATLQKIVKNPIPEDVKLAQRIAHTLKGSANIIGIKGIANMAHHLEDILEYLFENAVPPPKPLTDTMIEAADTLEIMVEVLLGKDDPPENAVFLLQEILDWANRIDKGQLDVSEEEIAKRKAEIAKSAQPAPQAAPTAAAAAAQAGPVAVGEAEQALRVPTRTIDNLLRLVGEMSISIGQIQERLRVAMQSTKSLNQQEMLMQQKSYDLETLVDVQDVSGRARHRQMGGAEDAIEKIKEEEKSDFDSLEFEQYNELHSLTHSFIETIADSREVSSSILDDLTTLDGMFITQERLQKELQQIVMTTRMVPIKTIAARLERIVRQTCRSTNKQADFAVVGGDLLMDGDVLTKLTDPLLHILRNSVDHGLETPEERVQAGKPETGSVILNCFRQGNNIVVRCEDNGKGLNYGRIREIAIERGLIKENQELSHKELGRLIFVAGFSTKGEVTQVSGRGVGMDVVHTSILDLKGSVDIDSVPGEGTAISLTLPMSLVTEHVLLVNVGNERYALPTSHLTQALAADSGEFRRIGDNISFHMDKNAYPVITLGELLSISGTEPVSENESRPLVLVHEEGKTTAVLVDSLLDSRDLVAKSMGKYVKHVRGVSSASILGDGSVVALLNLPELLRSPSQSLMSSAAAQASDAGGAVEMGIPHIMIVDDSLSVRKSLSQLVGDEGYETILAKDGLEAVEMVSQKKPNIMLVDMEMPRMNGIELTAHIRANDATKDIPIFMITSRTTEKHRNLAKEAGVTRYLTKPYQDTELLGYITEALSR